ncbi:MAG: hypothetical protein FD189_156 [Elusimicrobia bacterium]|nr:MAG: hypothetical protein FD154_308 [Elusimicrobiota bacterium]KAF0158164.1 MAG: hypothetical protein FD189_156 [Elusimicrobiota bacterium]
MKKFILAAGSLKLFFPLLFLISTALAWETAFNRGAPVHGRWWFMALGAALLLNTAACQAPRFASCPRRSLLLHAGILLVIGGAFASGAWKFSAQLPLTAGYAATEARTETAVYRLPFSVKLISFRVLYDGEPEYSLAAGGAVHPLRPGGSFALPDGTRARVLSLYRDLGIGPDGRREEKSPYYFNPAAELELSSGTKKENVLLFAELASPHGGGRPGLLLRVAGARPAGYESEVELKVVGIASDTLGGGAAVPADGEELRTVISVNSPVSFYGYKLYQHGYDPADPASSTLLVKRDPGVWPVYAGFALLLAGLFLWIL